MRFGRILVGEQVDRQRQAAQHDLVLQIVTQSRASSLNWAAVSVFDTERSYTPCMMCERRYAVFRLGCIDRTGIAVFECCTSPSKRAEEEKPSGLVYPEFS